mmetsp:Transcript_136967/g.292564  ORF Transcript_136967/g.292564 Transcript_136967/m.292564 type:complete len:264 (-) Transcript_136967:42-833(-)
MPLLLAADDDDDAAGSAFRRSQEGWREREESPKTVVCFGDSNTWGFSGRADKFATRIPYGHRWTTVLQSSLGDGVVVIPEGLNGRTTVWDDPLNFANAGGTDTGATNGRRYLMPCLNSHKPVDLVVLGLGCNDLKTRFSLQPSEIVKGCRLLIQDIKKSGCGTDGGAPMIVLVSTPVVRVTELHEDFGPERKERSSALIKAYEVLAKDEGLSGFVSLADVPTSDDGLHFDETSSRAIGEAVTEKVAAALVASSGSVAKKQRVQ